MVKYTELLELIAVALHSNEGPDLAYLVRPTSPHGKDLFDSASLSEPTLLLQRQSLRHYEGMIDSPWDEITIQYVLVTSHIAKKRYLEAFKEHTTLVHLFYRFFEANNGWTLPVLFAILRDLRDLALDADVQIAGTGSESKMEDAARTIQKAFTLCMTDRTSPYQLSRKWGVYYVVGLIMKSYFRIRKISLSKSILRSLDANTDMPALGAYPKSHQVTYRYYIGMLSFLNEDYTKAEKELTLAFYSCHNDATNNRERILTYLIPLRILRGHLPSEELLVSFPALNELYSPFIEAIRSGNIRDYDDALNKWELRLIDLNLYLTLEKARELSIRGLFRRVWVASQKSNRVPVAMFHSASRISGQDVTLDEAECLVANMIYRGYIRGYISHEKRMVVLANTNAFPRLADRPAPYNLY
ncbi:hypothetical protein K488DRAFT_48729 [Vararia minispora EC-137]|uniref:Uncharacterized protein n=1 Tax=Vararia minispora EC-137 TaxID=1314806 RepID=A0ACB8QMN5_9AGAM|nr:hypothetical protein K488DRAFT_48729 [Vararia minispora EC-137]